MLFAGMNSSAFEWDDHGFNTDLIKDFFVSLGRVIVKFVFCQGVLVLSVSYILLLTNPDRLYNIL